jgi:ABC-type amino acid transport system permease subunit
LTARLRDLFPYGAGLLCAAMFPTAHWAPLRVTLALAAAAALLGVLAGACMALERRRSR